MEEKRLYILIYGYLLTRIRYGFYPKGEYLPSIHKLSHLFGVSTMAVRKAVQLLEQKGYITTTGNRRTIVIYDAHDPQRALPDSVFLSDQELKTIHQSFDLIFPQVFYYGLSACDPSMLQELHLILDQPTNSWDAPTVVFLAKITEALHNPLLLDLYYDVMLFTYPSHLSKIARDPVFWELEYQKLHEKFKDLLALRESGHMDALWDLIQKTYPEFGVQYSNAQADIHTDTYHWGKIQICHAAANKIIRRIYTGEYTSHTFLPSARVLAEEFSIPTITMRRSIALLNDLGVTESVNGVGTKVLSPEQSFKVIKWENPAVRKNIMLYLESLHILTVICRPLISTAFPIISQESREHTIEEIRVAQSTGQYGVAIGVCLMTLISAAGLSALRRIYEKLLDLLIWGQTLSCIEPPLNLGHHADLLANSLDRGDSLQFGAALEQALTTTFLSSQKKAVSIGIEEAAMLFLPSGPGPFDGH